MNTKAYDVIAIGNAIVDVLSQEDDAFIARHAMPRNDMRLIDAQQAESIYADMSQTTEVSGGSAANTLAGMAQLGAKTCFIGRVRDDALGKHFRHDLNAVGVEYTTPYNTSGAPTARCLIVVTGDGERTMNTYLGAAGEVFEGDVEEATVNNARIVLGEGYMWDKECTKAAILKAFRLAKAHGGKVAFTTSAVFCIAGHRDEFQQLIDDHIDILFCNEEEAKALYPEKNFEQVLDHLQAKCDIVAVTMSEKGSIILTKDKRYAVAATPVEQVVDTTGAGDMYSAGFLYGLTRGFDMERCAKLGGACAAKVIQRIGARIDTQEIQEALAEVSAKHAA